MEIKVQLKEEKEQMLSGHRTANVHFTTRIITKNSEIAGWGNVDWENERAKPTYILIQNQQRMSEIYRSINNSLNLLFRNMEVASEKNSCKSHKRVINCYFFGMI